MASSLLNGLISFWNLTEDLVDPVNEVTLAANGVVATAGANPPYAFSACRSFSGTSYLEDDADAGTTTFYRHPATQGWTVSAWVNLGTLATFQTVISKPEEWGIEYAGDASAPRFSIGFGANLGNKAIYFGRPAGPGVSGTDPAYPELRIVAGKWFHLVGRFRPINPQGIGTLDLVVNNKTGPYQRAIGQSNTNVLNGQRTFSSYASISVNSNRLLLGAYTGGTFPLSAGSKMCGVGIWGRALSDAEVGDLWSSGPAVIPNDGDFQGAVYPFAS